MEYSHVYPANDLIEHETDSHDPPCQCNPRFDYNFEKDYCIIVHASLDRRECVEGAERE